MSKPSKNVVLANSPKISIENAVKLLTDHTHKNLISKNLKFSDIEAKLGELTDSINGATPDIDAFVRTLQSMNTKIMDYEKRFTAIETALSIKAPQKKRGGTIKMESVKLDEEEDISFS